MVDHDGDLKIFGHKSRGPLASGCVMYILIHETGTAGFDKMSTAVLQTWMESATDSLRDQTVSFLLQRWIRRKAGSMMDHAAPPSQARWIRCQADQVIRTSCSQSLMRSFQRVTVLARHDVYLLQLKRVATHDFCVSFTL